MTKTVKIYIGIVTILCLFVGNLHAQSSNRKDDETVVIPKDEFVEVVARAVKERRLKNRLLSEQYKAKNRSLRGNSRAYDRDRDIERLEQQINALMLLFIAQNTMKGNTVQKAQTTDEENTELSQKVDALLAETNKLQHKLNEKKDGKVVVDNSELLQKLALLTAETNALKKELAEQPKQVQVVEQPRQLSAYAGQEKRVYFANNSYRLSADAIANVNAVIAILKQEPNLEVMLKGFASKVGNPIYNQKLSMKRADNVKQAFISSGIAPGRVLTTYHGEDFSNVSDADARRVDITIIDAQK